VPPVIAAIIAIGAVFGVGVTVATATTILVSLIMMGASLALGAISKLFTKDSASSSLLSQAANRTVTSRQAVAPRRVCYGQNRLGGILTFLHTTGANSQFLHLVITLAGHQVNAIPNMYFDGVLVPLDGSGNATGNFAGFVHAEINLGTATQAAFPGLVAAAPAAWTSAYRQRGCAGVYVQLTWDQNKFPNGVPNITFDVNGRQVYDPRSGNIAFSSNAALCIADYLNNARFGLVAQTKYPLTAAMLTQSGLTGFTAANAVDLDVTTVAWGTNPSLANAAATIDLGAGQSAEFRRVRMYLSATLGPATYVIERSDDAAVWTTAIQETQTVFSPDSIGWNEVELAPFGAHRYWRVRLANGVTTTVTVNELEFYTSDVDTTLLIAAANSCDEAVSITASPNDTFIRANGPPGNPPWTMVTGSVYAINTNRLECTNGGGPMAYNAVTFPNDQFSQATIQQIAANQNFSVGVRLSLSADTGYFAHQFGTELRLVRVNAGVATELTFWNFSYTVGDVIRLEIVGSTLNIKRNGISLGTFTDGTPIVSGASGFYCFAGNGMAAGTGNMWTNWSGGTAGASPLTEPRYTCDGSFDTHELPSAILGRLLSSTAGSALYVAGKWGIYPAIWRAPTISLGDHDYRAPIMVQTRRTHRDLFNGVKGVFISPTNNWQISDYPPLQSPVFLAEDNNEPLWLDVELPFTISASMAQRLSKLNLRRVRKQVTVSAQFKFGAYQAQPIDVINLSHARFGWTNKTFEVISSSLVYVPDNSGNSLCVGVDMQLRESDSQVYDWTINDQVAIVPPPIPMLPKPVCQPPTGLGMSSTEIVRAADGIRQSGIIVTWISPADQFVIKGGAILVQYKKTADTLWQTETRADGAATQHIIVPVMDGISYDVRLWAENTSGVKSTITSASYTPSGLVARHASYSGYRPLTNPLTAHDLGSAVTASDPLTAALSGSWSTIVAGIAINNGVGAYSTTAANSMVRYNAATPPNDQYVQCTVSLNPGGLTGCGGICRANTGGANTFYFFQNYNGTLYVGKFVAGTQTNIISPGQAVAVGDVFKMTVSGSAPATLTVFRNGVQVAQTTDTDAALLSGQAGIMCASTPGGPTTSMNISTWSCGPLVGGSANATIAAFTMRVSGLDIAIGGGVIGSLSYNTLYYIWYDDNGLAGGSPTMNASLVKETALNYPGRFFVGSIQTPRSGAPDTIGNGDGGSGAQFGQVNALAMSVSDKTASSGGSAVVNNPLNAVDGDTTSFSSVAIVANSGTNFASLVLSGPAGIYRRYSSIVLKVRIGVPIASLNVSSPFGGYKLAYSLNGPAGAFGAFIEVSNGTAGTDLPVRTLSVVIPPGTNLSQIAVWVQVRGFTTQIGSLEADVYEVWIEATE